jgi:sporulation integral membrane protein YtvI
LNTTVEKRRALLINVAYFALIIGAFYLFMRYAFWTVSPFIFAFFIAMLLQKPVSAVTGRTPLKKGFVSFIAVLFIAVFFAGLVALAGTTVFTELKGFATKLTETFKSIPEFISGIESWILSLLEPLPDTIESSLAASVNEFTESLLSAFSQNSVITPHTDKVSSLQFDFSALLTPLSGVISTASKLPAFLISIIVFFIATCFITADYDRIVSFIKRQLPEDKRAALTKTKLLTLSTLGKMIKAYCLIICITFTEILIGLTALNLLGFYSGSYRVVISLCIALVDIFPILGSGTVLIPWGIIALVRGNIGLGIGLLILYVIITVLRQYIEPKLVAGQLGLPPAATLVAMYLGLKIFGIPGIFMLPLMITVLKVLNDDGVIHLWKANTAEGKSSVELKIPKLKTKKNTKGRKTK